MICLGGAVTSHDAGMAVPDGFTTFGSWSLIAPLKVWWPDPATRLEHTHRLLGYFVGFSSLAFLLGVMFSKARQRRGLVALAWGLLILVIVQAVLGILRVDERSLWLAGIHGIVGQVFLGLTVLAAAASGRYWTSLRPRQAKEQPVGAATDTTTNAVTCTAKKCRIARGATHALLTLLFIQLALGAAVRHGQAALAIPDWPLHYGQVMPPMSPEKLTAAVASYSVDKKLPPRYAYFSPNGAYETWQVHLHFTHRLMGYVTFLAGLAMVSFVANRYRRGDAYAIRTPAFFVASLMVAQVSLGIITVLSGENPNFATLHQTCGAALLASAVWLAIRVHLTPAPAHHTPSAQSSHAPSGSPRA